MVWLGGVGKFGRNQPAKHTYPVIIVRISINATFDNHAEQALAVFKNRIVEAHPQLRKQSAYRPHITLAAYEVDSPTTYVKVLKELANQTEQFPIQLDVLGVFPENGVVFYAPRMSSALLDLHRKTIQVTHAISESNLSPFLQPNQWTPHVTIAARLSRDEVMTVVGACFDYWEPVRGHVHGLTVRVIPNEADYFFQALKTLSSETI